MLDNLREDVNSSPFFDDEELPDFLEDVVEEKKGPKADTFAFLKPIIDLTPVQRFIISTMLFMAVCLIGSMFLLVIGRFSLF